MNALLALAILASVVEGANFAVVAEGDYAHWKKERPGIQVVSDEAAYADLTSLLSREQTAAKTPIIFPAYDPKYHYVFVYAGSVNSNPSLTMKVTSIRAEAGDSSRKYAATVSIEVEENPDGFRSPNSKWVVIKTDKSVLDLSGSLPVQLLEKRVRFRNFTNDPVPKREEEKQEPKEKTE